MSSSLTFLVRHFLNHPEHRFLLFKKVMMYPKLAEQFEAIQLDPSVEAWQQWFALFDRVAPELTQLVAQETSSLLFGSSPDLDAFPPESEGEPTVVETNQPLFEPLGAFAPSVEDQVRTSNREKKKMASRNSEIVYSSAPGWRKFHLEMKTGEVLPTADIGEYVRPLLCHMVEQEGEIVMEELRLCVSDHRTLGFHDRKWYWQNTSKTERKLKMDIKDISKVLKADVVDMLLDLVLPGIFLQASDAYLSVSIAPGELSNAEQPEASDQAAAPAAHQGAGPQGDQGVMAMSPFAIRPISADAAETTLTRMAVLEPNHPSLRPKELTITCSTALSWFSEWLGRRPREEWLCTLQINETHIFESLGISITFTIESTANSIFPWVCVERSATILPHANVSLCWNNGQLQQLPPDFKSTGALSRQPEVGSLIITIQTPGYRDQWLTIRWQP